MRARYFLLALMLAACGGSGSHHQIVVFAAASLTGPFTTIAHAFEHDGGARVLLSFGASQALATQIADGARANVFAAASNSSLQPLIGSGLVRDHTVFARNKLVVVVPASNDAKIASFRDLARPGIALVIAAEGVPAGAYARAALAKAGILDQALRNVRSNEPDVKAVVQRVVLGEADGGIVYVTDATPDVRTVAIPDAQNVIAEYPIAELASSSDEDAPAFIRFVLGARGRQTLRDAGFMDPA